MVLGRSALFNACGERTRGAGFARLGVVTCSSDSTVSISASASCRVSNAVVTLQDATLKVRFDGVGMLSRFYDFLEFNKIGSSKYRHAFQVTYTKE